METYFIAMNSYTEAMSGKNFLQSLNIKCSVEKRSGKNGCTYGIKVKGDPDKASRLLGAVGLNADSITGGKHKP